MVENIKNLCRLSYPDNVIFQPSKIYSNPHKDDFDDDICHLKAKSVVDTVKCYIIAILYDVQCFSLKNFSPDGPAAISFLIAKIGLHKKVDGFLVRSL